MKQIRKPILTLLFALTTAATFAQKSDSKPKMFAAFPQTIQFDADQLLKSFDLSEGSEFRLTGTSGFVFEGKVNSNIRKYANLQSMVIESTNYDHAIFTLSRQITDDKTSVYVGRILHRGKSDGFKLFKDEKGNYSLIKIDTENILQDCSYVK